MLALGLSLVAVVACGGGSAAEEVDPAVYQQGATLYGEFCSSCHAADGRGGVGPRLANGAAASLVGNVSGVRDVIAEGGDRMPGLASRLNPEQIDAIARYVHDRL